MPTSTFLLDARLIDLTAVARGLCAGAGKKNPEYVRACAEMIIDSANGFLNNDEHKDDLIAFLGSPDVDPFGPLTDDQRRALFALFSDVFGHTSDEARYAFTRMALCLPADAPVSWSSKSSYCLTYADASTVLDALDMLDV